MVEKCNDAMHNENKVNMDKIFTEIVSANLPNQNNVIALAIVAIA